MNMLKNLLSLGVALLLLGFSTSAAAAKLCTAFHSMTLSPPPLLELDDRKAVGEVLWGPATFHIYQSGGGGKCREANVQMDIASPSAASGSPATYPLGVPGVGYRINIRSGMCATGHLPLRCTGTFGPDSPAHVLEFSLVKTGPIGAGTITKSVVATWWANNDRSDVYAVLYASTRIQPKKYPTCAFSAAGPIQASLGEVPANSFKGVGSTSTARPFSIDLQCAGGDPNTSSEAWVTLTDATDSGNRSKVLTLSADSSARGVGIEILNGSTVLGYGPDATAPRNPNHWHAGTIAEGGRTFSIPLTARYVQIEPVVSPGTAKGRATFTMSYQ